MKRIDAEFFAPRTPVAIVDWGQSSHEAVTLRMMLESLGANPDLLLCGTPRDFLRVLEASSDDAIGNYLVICGHGDDDGFIFGEYAEAIDVSSLQNGKMPPSSIKGRVNLPDVVVISTACASGNKAMVDAFLTGQIRAYIAPDGYPLGSAVSLLVNAFFFYILVEKESIETAFHRAQELSFEQFSMFTLNKHRD